MGTDPTSAWSGPRVLNTNQSAFSLGGRWHLADNILFFHIYDDNLEREMGHSKFLCFYLLCALATGVVQMVSDPGSSVQAVGSSGAVAGVMGGYLLQHKSQNLCSVHICDFLQNFLHACLDYSWLLLCTSID